jgi:hypothetical protein
MTSESRKHTPIAPDAADVISGPIGSASLRDPATSGPEGADLAKLPPIDLPPIDLPLIVDSPPGPTPDHTTATVEAGLPSRS